MLHCRNVERSFSWKRFKIKLVFDQINKGAVIETYYLDDVIRY